MWAFLAVWAVEQASSLFCGRFGLCRGVLSNADRPRGAARGAAAGAVSYLLSCLENLKICLSFLTSLFFLLLAVFVIDNVPSLQYNAQKYFLEVHYYVSYELPFN